jgi:Family of unknown function (DUF5755)
MTRRGTSIKCPPGVLCIPSFNTGHFILGGLLFLILLICFYILPAISVSKERERSSSSNQQDPNNNYSPQITNIVSGGGDDRYTMAPRPLRFWNVSPDLRGALLPSGAIPINVSTQGLPESYQSMGVIKTSEGTVLPLYGRRTTARSDRFNYYTRTDTYNPVPLPIEYNKRNCQEDVGCNELFDGETVTIKPTGQTATSSIYRFDGPTYIPGIV